MIIRSSRLNRLNPLLLVPLTEAEKCDYICLIDRLDRMLLPKYMNRTERMNQHVEKFSPIKSKRTFEEVAYQIKKMVFNGTLNEGDKLPGEEKLARQFNVGRQSIREALRMLELSGLITIMKGTRGGPVVNNRMPDKIRDMFLDSLKLGDFKVNEFGLARIGVEKMILSEVIKNADAEDVERLEQNIAEAWEEIEKGKRATDNNFEFHSILARASKNNVFIVLEHVINQIQWKLRSQCAPDLKLSRNAVRAHEKIVQAIVKKDLDRANALMEKHVGVVARSLDPLSTDS